VTEPSIRSYRAPAENCDFSNNYNAEDNCSHVASTTTTTDTTTESDTTQTEIITVNSTIIMTIYIIPDKRKHQHYKGSKKHDCKHKSHNNEPALFCGYDDHHHHKLDENVKHDNRYHKNEDDDRWDDEYEEDHKDKGKDGDKGYRYDY
jgi:hypothetical protein